MPELELHVGDVHELVLEGHGSAGYAWQTELVGPEGVLEIHRAPSTPTSRPPPGAAPPASGSLPEVFQLIAIGKGEVHLHLTLRRPWETNGPPLEQHEIEITIS